MPDGSSVLSGWNLRLRTNTNPTGYRTIRSFEPSLPSLGRPRAVPAAPNLSLLGQHQSFTIERPLNAHTGQQPRVVCARSIQARDHSLPSLVPPRVTSASPNLSLSSQHQISTRARPLNAHVGQQCLRASAAQLDRTAAPGFHHIQQRSTQNEIERLWRATEASLAAANMSHLACRPAARLAGKHAQVESLFEL